MRSTLATDCSWRQNGIIRKCKIDRNSEAGTQIQDRVVLAMSSNDHIGGTRWDQIELNSLLCQLLGGNKQIEVTEPLTESR